MKKSAVPIAAALIVTASVLVTWNLWAQDAAEPAPAADIAAEPQWQHLALAHDAEKAWNDRELAQQINKLGRDGWEMVSVLNFNKDGTTNNTIYYFKKPL